MVIAAIVGMPGAGKTEAAKFFEKAGFERIYFGGFVIDELEKSGLPVREEFERKVREEMRQKHGMAAPALLSIPKIEKFLSEKKDVIIEDLYSWEELLALQKHFSKVIVVAIFSSPKTRYERLSRRPVRPLTAQEARARDISEIENLQKGGPIAIADYNVHNEGTKKELEKEIKKIIMEIGAKRKKAKQ